MKSVILKT